MTPNEYWRQATLSEVVQLQRGHDLPAPQRREGSVPILGSFGVTGFHDTAHYPGPGVSIGRSGASIGTATYVTCDYWPLNTVLFVKDFKGHDERWVYYLLHAIDFSGYNSGSAQPSLNRNYLVNIAVQVPPLAEQRGIAATLGTLDDKVASNRRLLSVGLNLTSAEVRAATSEMAVLVPVTALARFVNGGAYTKGATGSGRMVLRIAELNSGPGASTVYTELDVPNDKTARAGDLLMSWSGSLDIYRWTGDEAIINQHIFKVIPNELPAWLAHDRLKTVMPIFQSIAKDKATTMGHIQRGHLESTTVPLPSPERIARLDARLGPLWDRLLLAERENHTLAALRDALLPELLSGRIRVPEASEVVDKILA